MTEEQKEFTVKEIEKYNEAAKSEKREAYFLMSVGIAMLGLFASCHYSIETLGGIMSLIATSLNFSSMIGSFARRAGLEKMAADLQYQLDMANLKNQDDKYEDLFEEEKGPRL